MKRLIPLKVEDLSEYVTTLKTLDARMLLQMAGENYHYPMTERQVLKEMLTPTHLHFKYMSEGLEKIIGYVQMTRIDTGEGSGRVGRVFILPEFRGMGYSENMLKALLEYAQKVLRLSALTLNVYAFNTPALKCYQSLGFVKIKSDSKYYETIDETWEVFNMAIDLEQR